MMADHNRDDEMVDALFADIRAGADPVPGDGLLSRIMADAAAEQPHRVREVSQPRAGILTQLKEAIGGWPAFAGMATATVAGIWIGINPPDTMAEWTANVWFGDEGAISAEFASDFDNDFDLFLLEG